MSLTSDPHAWLRSYYLRLHSDPAFRDLAPAQQFLQLCEIVAADHAAEAIEMRQWTAAAQDALIDHLAASIQTTPPKVISELWRVTKGERELRCSVQYLGNGIDVRLYEGAGLRRTQLCHDAAEADALSQQWRKDLQERGWQAVT